MFSEPSTVPPPIAPPYQPCCSPSRRCAHHVERPSHDTATEEKRSLDFTQRLERKWAEYNSSQNVFKRWLFEILSWLVSALCMAAVVGIYAYLSRKPLSAAGNLLSYANALGKIASAALIIPTTEALGQLKWNWFNKSKAMWDFEIFDKASRGAWGAIMLLFRTKGRSLAALGALLIVLLLAIDTFFQQVVDMPTRWALAETFSTIPATINYAPVLDKVYREGAEMNVKIRSMSAVVDEFAYKNGTQPITFGNGTRPDIPLSCPTSNCTWPVYDTLGVCSQCEDVSDLLSYACLRSKIDWTSDLWGPIATPRVNETTCGYYLNATSENPMLMSGYIANNGTPGETLVMRALPLTTVAEYVPFYGNGSIRFKSLRNTIQDVVIVSAANGSVAGVHQNRRPVAQECVLSWCVKTMRSSYFEGTYKEEVISTVHNTSEGPLPWIAIPFETDFQNGTDNFYLQNISIDTERGVYGGPNYTASTVYQAFQEVFPSYMTWTNSSSPMFLRWRTFNRGPPYLLDMDFNPWMAPNNVTRHMERLATAMTNVMRSDPSTTMLKGNSFNKETFVSIKWQWLSFPFLLLLLSLVFLISTIIKTSGDDGMGFWKTSAMPALIYSLPKEAQSQFTSSATWNSKGEASKKTRIQLLPKSGWRISGQSHLSRSPRLPSGERVPRGWI